MKKKQNDTFVKLNTHKRILEHDVEIANEIDELCKEEVNRIVTKVQRKQTENHR